MADLWPNQSFLAPGDGELPHPTQRGHKIAKTWLVFFEKKMAPEKMANLQPKMAIFAPTTGPKNGG